MTRISPRDLRKVENHPEVKAAIEALDVAVEADRQAYSAWRDAAVVAEKRAAELNEIAARVLAEQENQS